MYQPVRRQGRVIEGVERVRERFGRGQQLAGNLGRILLVVTIHDSAFVAPRRRELGFVFLFVHATNNGSDITVSTRFRDLSLSL